MREIENERVRDRVCERESESEREIMRVRDRDREREWNRMKDDEGIEINKEAVADHHHNPTDL